MRNSPDLSKVISWKDYREKNLEDLCDVENYQQEAFRFINNFHWCKEILESYIGMYYSGIIGVFLYRILPANPSVDEWIWIIVGDLPPAYLTTDQCPNPATALDGYIGAMEQWIKAVDSNQPVDDLIPINAEANKDNAILLSKRLKFLDSKILINYKEDLKS
ncbi:hypothetical protein [Pseudomonas sp. JZ134]|uniref:hypothetical protein n=1 Tax=Pseudomonas sp. JZ134 TaxID=2806615 RepID=UPI003DA06F01